MSTTFNLFDIIFIAFAFIFVIIAFFRGFVKEIFSLCIWIAALLVSYFGAPFLAKLLASYCKNKMVLDAISRTILFISTFFILSFSTSNLSDALKDKMPQILDRSLGVLYGIGKTLLIFSVFYAVTLNLYGFLLGKDQDPDGNRVPIWLSEARSGNILRITGEAINPAVSSFMSAITKNFNKPGFLPATLDDKIDEVVDEEDGSLDISSSAKTQNNTTTKSRNTADMHISRNTADLNNKSNSKNKTASQDQGDPKAETIEDAVQKDTGYNMKDIEKMNRLIEVVGKNINSN